MSDKMTHEDFVEMAARMLTNDELKDDGNEPCSDSGAILDSLIEQAREITQAFAPEKGITAGRLFDDLGERIMSLKKNARVVVRQLGIEALVTGIEFRDNAVVLDIADVAEEEATRG